MAVENHLTDGDDECRRKLLNDPNYGIVLCFLEKFRSVLDIPSYPFQQFEDHLINCEEEISSCLIDFHFSLLKRLSLARNAQRENFQSIITKVTSRYDLDASKHLMDTGYLRADISVKIHIIKNLLESQFDVHPTFKNMLFSQSANEFNSSPTGRDRFGASYWLYMDPDCFIRVFREDVDVDRTWTNVVKNQDELETIIKLLITDSVVRTKFPDWSFDNEDYSSLPITKDFAQRYSSDTTDISEKERKGLLDDKIVAHPSVEDDIPLALRRSSRVRKPSVSVSQLSNTKPVRQSRRKPSSTSDMPSKEESHSDDYQSQTSSIDHAFEHEDHPLIALTPTLCYVCSHDDRPEVLLLCDQCNDAYHLECLRPILLFVPEGDWFCPLCEHQKLANYFIDRFVHLNALRISTQRAEQQKIVHNSPASKMTTIDDEQSDLSQYGRRRRLRFEMKDILSSEEESSDDYDTTESYTQAIDIDLQFPEKVNRLLQRRDHLSMRTCSTRPTKTPLDSEDINEELGSALVYVNCEGDAHVTKSAIINSKQTSQITRRWNDVRRRSRLRALTGQCTDENSFLHPDDNENVIIQSQGYPVEPMTDATSNLGKQLEDNFDRLTRDIQLAVNKAHLSSTTLDFHPTDQRPIKSIPKTRFSPYTSKSPRFSLSSKPLSNACNTFRSSDSPLTSDIIDPPKENFASSSIEPLPTV